MQTVLVIEDEVDIADLVVMNLERAGYRVLKSHDGREGLQMALTEKPDIIVLDLMLPSLNGLGVLKGLRKNPSTNQTPVVMLTARAQTEDRIAGLAAGADDYVTKPFSPKELVLRVQAVLKRMHTNIPAEQINTGAFVLDKNKLQLFINDSAIDLTSTEFKMMSFFMEQPTREVSRNDVLKNVWGYSDEVISRTLDTHMKRLRQKLGTYGNCLETIRGIGYRFMPPA